MIDEIAATGASHVALVVTWAQADIRANRIARGKLTMDDAIVRALIDHAHERDLKVMLFPILTVRKLSPGQWRGTIRPRDVDAWWRSYERFILHYATMAADRKTAALLVGSELGTTEAWKYRWYHLISAVERIYRGDLVYSANWDHYHQVSFWRRLSMIGVTGYFELATGKSASEETLYRAWRKVRSRLLAFARQRKKPLWITEVGYTSVDGTAMRPWDYLLEGRTDHEEQRRAYAAFIRAWNGTRDLGGVFFWNWYGRGGSADRGYTPKGKPAGKALKAWYRGR